MKQFQSFYFMTSSVTPTLATDFSESACPLQTLSQGLVLTLCFTFDPKLDKRAHLLFQLNTFLKFLDLPQTPCEGNFHGHVLSEKSVARVGVHCQVRGQGLEGIGTLSAIIGRTRQTLPNTLSLDFNDSDKINYTS